MGRRSSRAAAFTGLAIADISSQIPALIADLFRKT
jgi:hypothetical protein